MPSLDWLERFVTGGAATNAITTHTRIFCCSTTGDGAANKTQKRKHDKNGPGWGGQNSANARARARADPRPAPARSHCAWAWPEYTLLQSCPRDCCKKVGACENSARQRATFLQSLRSMCLHMECLPSSR